MYFKIREFGQSGEIDRAIVSGEKLLSLAVKRMELIPRAKKYIRAAVMFTGWLVLIVSALRNMRSF